MSVSELPGVSRVLLLAPRKEVYHEFAALGSALEAHLAPIPIHVLRGWRDEALQVPEPGDALVAGGQSRTHEVLRAGAAWSWFHLMSSGADHIEGWGALPGEPVITYSRGVNARSVAEWIMAAMLYFYRDLNLYTRQSGEGRWKRRWGRELGGATLVVLGAGAAGSETARLAQAFAMRTVGVSRSGRELSGFDEVIPRSDFEGSWELGDVTVVLLPATPETKGSIGAPEISCLRRGSLLVVASRGGIVDEDAIVDAVEEERLAGAALDVFDREPLPSESPLWDHPRILVTPHVAGTTDRFMERTAKIIRAIWTGRDSDQLGHPAREYYLWESG